MKSAEFVTIGMPGDSVTLWRGVRRDEKRLFGRRLTSRFRPGFERFVVRLPCTYDLIDGGDYVNHHLVGVIQNALRENRLLVTRLCSERICNVIPIIAPCALMHGELYSIVNIDAEESVGTVACWQDLAGTRNKFYSDGFIMDIIAQMEVMGEFAVTVQRQCRIHHIPFNDLGDMPIEFTLPPNCL